jgi:pilus assembly protein CpaB
MQVLVAKADIGMGQRLSSASVEWQDWPQDSMRPEYVTVAAEPNAITDMIGSIARFEIFPGEPIRKQKLAGPDQGYLSAILDSGERGVSVSVTADSASGGFIVPNDHVDVVLAHASTTSGQVSQTVLHNVRVLAINTRLGETGKTGAPADPSNPHAEIFAGQAIATLELNPTQSEVIINAGAQGKLSLVLRSLTDSAEIDKAALSPTNQAIHMTSPFWSK